MPERSRPDLGPLPQHRVGLNFRSSGGRPLLGKDEASAYMEGRTLSWLKVKQPRYREGERGWEPQKS
jgi:hypothetical protein